MRASAACIAGPPVEPTHPAASVRWGSNPGPSRLSAWSPHQSPDYPQPTDESDRPHDERRSHPASAQRPVRSSSSGTREPSAMAVSRGWCLSDRPNTDLAAALDDPRVKFQPTSVEPRDQLLAADGNLRRRIAPEPVSYTHLRAHETVLDLVC